MNKEGKELDVKVSRKAILPFSLPSIDADAIEEVVDTLQSGWITTGPKTKRFESEFAKFIGCRYAIAVSSCTAALHLALDAIGVKEGDEVITTPYTFTSTAEAVLYLKARPIFVDCRKDTFNIDPEEILPKITPKTKAIIPVHFAGQPCCMDEILEIAKSHNLKVIEDAAHAFPARYKGRMIGTIGDITCFSFYATKNLTTGEGGMIATDNEDLTAMMRIKSLHGISKDAWMRYSAEGSWYYEIVRLGYKYNFTDIQAAIGIHQLQRINDFHQIRAKYAQMYNEGFKDLPELVTPWVKPDVEHSWHLYVIQLVLERLRINRAEFIKALKAEKIGSSVHFIPLHLHPYYRERFGYRAKDFPNAFDLYQRVVSLPLYPKMTEDDVGDVIRAVRKIVKTYRK